MTLYQRRLETEERMIRERRRHVIRKEYRGGHHFIGTTAVAAAKI
jgi:hypothetical protein